MRALTPLLLTLLTLTLTHTLHTAQARRTHAAVNLPFSAYASVLSPLNGALSTQQNPAPATTSIPKYYAKPLESINAVALSTSDASSLRSSTNLTHSLSTLTQYDLSTDYDFTALDLDTAAFRVLNLLTAATGEELHVNITAVSQVCYHCLSLPLLNIAPNTVSEYIELGTNFGHDLTIYSYNTSDGTISLLTTYSFHLGFHGGYTLVIQGTSTLPSLTLLVDHEPDNIYTAIGVMFAVLIGAKIVWVLLQKLYRMLLAKFRARSVQNTSITDPLLADGSLASPTAATDPTSASSTVVAPRITAVTATKRRLRSLDTFRGASLSVMIFVNYGGGGYWFFDHSYWNGLTVADLVFPW